MTNSFVVLILLSSTFDVKLKSNNSEVKALTFSFYLRAFTSTSDELFYISIYISTFRLFHQKKIIPIKTVDSEVCGLSEVTGALFLESHAAVEFHECYFSMLRAPQNNSII